VAWNADTTEAVDTIHTCTSIQALILSTIINVGTAVLVSKPGQALTGVLINTINTSGPVSARVWVAVINVHRALTSCKSQSTDTAIITYFIYACATVLTWI